jgi:Skp family chaperone for outer membrane proteins
MKKFAISLFTTFFIFIVAPVYLFAKTDHDAITKVKTEAEAKELKRQASEEIKKIKEDVKAMKRKAADDEDTVKKSTARKKSWLHLKENLLNLMRKF